MSIMRTKSDRAVDRATTDEPEYQLKKTPVRPWTSRSSASASSSAPASSPSPAGGPGATPGPSIVLSFVDRRGRAAGWPPSATPSSPRRCRCPGRPTRSPTPRSARSSRGSSAGTCCSSSCSAPSVVAQGWSAYFASAARPDGITCPAAWCRTDGSALRPAGVPARRVLTALVASGIKESLRVNLVLVGDQAVHRPVRHHRRHRLHQVRQLHARSSRRPRPAKRERGPRVTAHPGALRVRRRRPSASSASWPAPRSSSSPTSASTSSPPPPRRPRTRSATCRSASSPRSSSARCSTRRRVGASRAWSRTTRSTPRPPWPRRSRASGKSGYATVISAGAVAGLTTVVMTLLIGATRVLFAMSRDWLLPPWLGKTNPAPAPRCGSDVIVGRRRRPRRGRSPRSASSRTWSTSAPWRRSSSCRSPCRSCAARRPDLKRAVHGSRSARSCRSLAALICGYLMLNLPVETWIRFLDLDGAGLRHLLRLRLQATADSRETPRKGEVPSLTST